MSTGGPPPSPWLGRFETAKTVCFCIVVLFFGFWFCVGFFGVGCGSSSEPFHPHKMSQVPKTWPPAAWDEDRSVQVNPLRNLELKLRRGLESIPQDTANREWQYVPWHAQVPERPQPEPFQFYDQWAANNYLQ